MGSTAPGSVARSSPGDRLELAVELVRLSARAGKGHGTASVDGEKACECDLLFVVVDA